MPARTTPIVLLAAAVALLSSCGTSTKTPMTRTTTYAPRSFGVAAGAGDFVTTVTEQPYESPAYTASGTALFSRP